MEYVEKYKDILWSVKYTDSKKDEFDKLMTHWMDVEYVSNYLRQNEGKITSNQFFSGNSINEIVHSIVSEAKQLLKGIYKLCLNAEKGKHPDICDRFVNLDKIPYSEENECRKKLYGYGITERKKSLLRLYAIRLNSEDDAYPGFIITSGGIKMTRAIKQDANLNHAWQMLVSVEKDLRAKGIRTLERMMIYCNENKY